MTRVEYVARELWDVCQKATGRSKLRENFDDLPVETQGFWIAEARDFLRKLRRIEG